MKLKTKKILLLLAIILALIFNLINIIFIYSGIINIETIDNSISVSNNAQLIYSSICILTNTISIFLILKNLLKHKKILIFLNIIQILFGNLFNILAGIFNIVILSKKTSDIESEEKVKKELPALEDITKHKWYIYLLILLFFIVTYYTPIMDLLHIQIPDSKIGKITCIIILYAIQIIGLVIPMWNELKRDFIVFKNNFKLYLSNILPRFGIIVLIYFIANMLIFSLVGNISTNQEMINNLPIYVSAISALIIAPLTEELMFRGFMKKFIKNDLLFIIISSLSFGALHVIPSTTLLQALYIIPYSLLGLAFALNYVKTKNIVTSIFLHCLWNSIGVIGMILSTTL